MPQRILGAIDVHRSEKATLDEDPVHPLQGSTGYAVAAHSFSSNATAFNGHLHTAMQSRAIIEQAKGVLMATLHCTADDAFAHLTRRSQATNRKLREVAGDVVAPGVGATAPRRDEGGDPDPSSWTDVTP